MVKGQNPKQYDREDISIAGLEDCFLDAERVQQDSPGRQPAPLYTSANFEEGES
jgi:hypothetical protein